MVDIRRVFASIALTSLVRPHWTGQFHSAFTGHLQNKLMGKPDQIADQLTQDILRGQYRPGERLPSERDLAARFDANRGAVREAMKKLEQLGIACIQPGGARVVPLTEASLDIVDPLLDIGDVPDEKLLDDTMKVISGLAQVAVESTITDASDEQLEEIRALNRPLFDDDLDQEQRSIAELALMRAIMIASNNLVCQLIARSLIVRMAGKFHPLHDHFSTNAADADAHRIYARQLDAAFANRDLEAIREILPASAKLQRSSVTRAFSVYRATQQQPPSEVAAS